MWLRLGPIVVAVGVAWKHSDYASSPFHLSSLCWIYSPFFQLASKVVQQWLCLQLLCLRNSWPEARCSRLAEPDEAGSYEHLAGRVLHVRLDWTMDMCLSCIPCGTAPLTQSAMSAWLRAAKRSSGSCSSFSRFALLRPGPLCRACTVKVAGRSQRVPGAPSKGLQRLLSLVFEEAPDQGCRAFRTELLSRGCRWRGLPTLGQDLKEAGDSI